MLESRHAPLFLVIVVQIVLFNANRLTAATYQITPTNSSVRFEIDHLVINTVAGRFKDFKGLIRFETGLIETSSLVGAITAASIDTGNESRDAHLRSADYFDVASHPEIRFQSKRVEREGNTNFLLGDLSIRGMVREIAIPFTAESDAANGVLRFRGRLELNRQDYGIGYDGFLDATVGDIVTIELAGEALAQ